MFFVLVIDYKYLMKEIGFVSQKVFLNHGWTRITTDGTQSRILYRGDLCPLLRFSPALLVSFSRGEDKPAVDLWLTKGGSAMPVRSD
jgi:hypothetical protein